MTLTGIPIPFLASLSPVSLVPSMVDGMLR